MLVKLNCFRAGANPGDIVEVDDGDGAALIAHGAATAADDLDAELDKETKAAPTVRGSAALQAASGAETGKSDEAPAP